jgi:uncharacterized protein (DUF2062 family)
MRHARAWRELRGSYTRRGAWLWLRRYGLRRFLRHPDDVHTRAEALNTGAFV